VRVEVANPGRQLRLGMYAALLLQSGRSRADGRRLDGTTVAVPRVAVQIIGDRSVVYLADEKEPGRFVERGVQVCAASGDNVEGRGIRQDDLVVVKGRFSLRAERERLGLRASAAAAPLPVPEAPPSTQVTVSDKGFDPSRISARAGTPLRLSFVRITDATCATEVAIPALKIRRALPLNEIVDVEITPNRSGDIEFACGIDMFRATIVVR
jgi:hypothetical protein